MKKVLVMILCLSLGAILAVGGTIAYLSDTDSDVNVMTMGEVDIEQLEYERVVEDGAWVSSGNTDKYGYTPDLLQEFTQMKPLYPAYFADGAIKWDDRANGAHQQSWGQVGASGSNQLFDDSVKNVIDKFVFVENTGKSDAYVRTIIAFECGSVTVENFSKIIMLNKNKDHWNWNWLTETVEIDGNKYAIAEVTYLGPKSNPTGILAPGAVSYPSLLQAYMTPASTNEDVKAIDGNGNGLYEILCLSQATQTVGFPDAATALTVSFGEATADNVKAWFENDEDGVKLPVSVDNADDLKAALKTGGETVVLLPGTYEMGGKFSIASGTTVIGADGAVVNGTITNTLKDVTVKNVEFSGKNPQRWAYATGSVVFEDCTFDASSIYALHFDGTTGADIVYRNCDIIGWVAITGGHNSLLFENCRIYGNGSYGVIRTYGNATIKDCTFDVADVNTTDVYQDGIHAVDCTITVINCTNVNGAVEDLFNVSGTGACVLQ